ncbi:MAG: cytochrome c [Pseudomonadota bacterium]|nr:cytochrome c [Pseudomonadota bacterium]
MRNFFLGAASALLLIAAAVGIAIWTGAYNFAASQAHPGAVREGIDTALQRSVAARAEGLRAPAVTPEQLRHGAGEFIEYCVHCHGGPGVQPHEWTRGMRPQPPHLAEAATRWTTEEVFWIVKHGIGMTGMPSFGTTASDETIWHIAAFVKRLPQTSTAEFARLQAELGSDGATEGHSHAAGEGH